MLIHIGFYKTGTTWFQQRLFSDTACGFYPLQREDSWPKVHIKTMAQPFFCVHDLDFNAQQTREWIEKTCRFLDEGVPVISNERLSGNPFFGSVDNARIAEKIHASFPEAKILIGIREQVSMIESYYHEYLKEGGALSLKSFLRLADEQHACQFSLDSFRFDRLIRKYRELFGAERVLVYPYEMFRTDPQNVLRKLGALVGLPGLEGMCLPEIVNANDFKWVNSKTRLLKLFVISSAYNGYSPLSLPIPLKYRKFAIKKIRRGLGFTIPQFLEDRHSRKQRQIISDYVADYYVESNKRTAALLDIDLGQLGYRVQ